MDDQLAFNLPLRGPITTAGFNMPIQSAPPFAPQMAQMPQPAPQPAPAFNMAMQPAPEMAPPGMAATQGTLEYSPWMNPATPVQMPNFMAEQETQDKLRALLDIKLKQATAAEADRKSSKKRETAARIFGGVIAPALAMFGGPGTASAASAFIKQARQSVDQGREQRYQDEQSALKGIQDLTSIVNTTTTKPLLEFMKMNQKANNLATTETGKNFRTQAGIQSREKIAGNAETGRNARFTAGQELKQRMNDARIGLGYDRIASMEKIAGEANQRIRELATLNAKVRQGIANQSDLTRRQAIAAQLQSTAIKLADGQAQHMNDLTLKISKDGLTDQQGNPLNPDDFAYQLPPHLQTLVQQFNTQPNDIDMDEAIQDVINPQRITQSVNAEPMGMGQQGIPTAPQRKPFGQASIDERKKRLYAAAQRMGIPFAQARKKIEGIK